MIVLFSFIFFPDASGHLKLADFGLSKIVSPTTSAVLDPTGTQGEVDNRNASATVAINLIKSILPLKVTGITACILKDVQ